MTGARRSGRGALRDAALVVAGAVLFLLAAAPPGSAVPAGAIGDPIRGKELLSEKGCISCHSIWGAGGDLGPDFAQVSANKNLPQILGDFWNHTPRMIEYASSEGVQWPRMSVEEMENVISYLYYLNIFDRPGDPEEGQIVFHRKACDRCHAVGPFDGGDVKALDRFAQYLTPMPLAQAMWNGAEVMMDMQRRRGIEMPWFEGREMAHIQAFLRRYGDRHGKPTLFKEPPNPFEGEKLFHEKRCDRCHSLEPGVTKVGPPLELIGLKKTLSEISGILWNHSYRMRSRMKALGIPFPTLHGSEMGDLIAFLYYYPFYREIGDREVGRRLFSQKGCVACHDASDVAARVKGGRSPEIKDYYIGFATAMWNHAPTMQEMLRQKKFQWPKFFGKEMRDLVTFIYYEGNGGGPPAE